MQAGVAAIDFTPAPGLILQGHLSKNPSHTVLYPLEARALTLKNNHQSLCLITLDVIGVELATTKRIRDAVSQKVNIPESNILVIASHTHCAPAMLKNLAMTPDPAWQARVEQAAVDCAIQSAQNLQPVTLGLGASSAYFNVNRRPRHGQTDFSVNWAGVIDHRVRMLRLDGANGKPLAVLFTFSCHPTTKPGNEGFISPDYPGVARAFIETQLNCRALFLPGTFGNIRPHINGIFKPATPEELQDVAHQLGRAVCRATANIRTCAADDLSIRQQELFLPFGTPKPTADLENMMKDQSTLGTAVRADWARRTLDRIARNDLPPGVTSIMQSARIGPLALVTIPGEPVQEIGCAIERRLAVRDEFQDVWPIGYTNDQIGYLVTERHKEEGGYEPNAYTFYDRPAPYKEEEKLIVNKAIELFAS